MSDKNTLPRFVRMLILGTVALGSAGVAMRAADLRLWSDRDAVAFLVLVLAICVVEQFSIPLRHRTETVNFALTDGLWAAALPLARPSALAFAIAGGVLLGQSMRRWAWFKIAFNVGQFLVGITVAQLVFATFRTGSPLEPRTWVAVATGAMGQRRRRPPRRRTSQSWPASSLTWRSSACSVTAGWAASTPPASATSIGSWQ